MESWKKQASGLRVHSEPGQVPLAPIAARPSRPRADWATIVQAVATVVAIVAVLPGVRLSLDALEEQRRINSSQLSVNLNQQDNFHRRYASSVSWWDTAKMVPGRRIGTVYLNVRNSSEVPLRPLFARLQPPGGGKLSSLDFAYVPQVRPCTTLSIELYDPTVVYAVPSGSDWPEVKWATREVFFGDPVSNWAIGTSSKATEQPIPKAMTSAVDPDSIIDPDPEAIYLIRVWADSKPLKAGGDEVDLGTRLRLSPATRSTPIDGCN